MLLFIAFIIGILLFYSSCYFPVTTGLIFLSSLLALFFIPPFNKSPIHPSNPPLAKGKLREDSPKEGLGGLRRISWLLLLILSGFLYAFIRFEPEEEINLPPQKIAVKGTFTSLPVEKEKGVLQHFIITSFLPLKSRNVVLYSDSGFTPGTGATMSIRIKPFLSRKTPGLFVENEMLTGSVNHIYSLNGSHSIRWLHQRLRYKLSRHFDTNFQDDASGFLQAISIGHRGDLSENTKMMFRRTGLSHILSISGTHFGFLSLFVFGLLRFMINSLPYRSLNRLTLWITPSEMAALLTIPVVTMYLFLSGMRVPAVRSFVMINLFLWGLLLGRKGAWLNGLFFSAFLIELFQPDAILSYSFQLSFIAVLFIGLAIEKFHKNDEELPSQKFRMRLLDYLRKMFIVMMAAYLGTLPLVLYGFHTLSFVSPVANLIVVPYICFIILPLLMFGSVIFLLTGFFPLIGFISLLAGYLLDTVEVLGKVHYASINVRAFPPIFVILLYLSLLSFFVTKKKINVSPENTEIKNENVDNEFFFKKTHSSVFSVVKKKKASFFIIPITIISLGFFYFSTGSSDLRVTFLDVGQGDASVVELPDGKTIVIDTGKTGKEVSAYLRYRGKNVIDSLLLSHGGFDHAGGLSYLSNSFGIRHLWDSGRIVYSDGFIRSFKETGTSIKHLTRGDVVSGRDISIIVLHPYNGFYTLYGNDAASKNNDSLVLKLKGRHTDFLFTGDIEREAEEDILSLKRVLQADVLKVAHHGSHTSSISPFLDLVEPGFSVISSGRWNAYGHPHKNVIQRLTGTELLRTDHDGTVCFIEKDDSLEIKKFSESLLKKAPSLQAEFENLKTLFILW